jgi:4-hydroxy-tetrahydrodipicolinate synthase
VTSPDSARFKRTVLATCCVPWNNTGGFDAALFRDTIRTLAESGLRDLYVFGTAGEGHAVSDNEFASIAKVFVGEVTAFGGEPMIGVINLSLSTVRERIEMAAELGCRLFQISLPNWDPLNDHELANFFNEICGRYPEYGFMHYNLARSGRVLRGSDYVRLAERHANLIATKYGAGDPEVISGLLVDAPQLRHFFTELGFFSGGAVGPCALLASISASNPSAARDYFEAVVAGDFDAAAGFCRELSVMLVNLRRAVGPGPHLDGAYDKIVAKLVDSRFPLRLKPPWQASTLEAFHEYAAFLEAQFPRWLPERAASDGR